MISYKIIEGRNILFNNYSDVIGILDNWTVRRRKYAYH